MKKLKNNIIIDLKNKSEYEKVVEMGKLSRMINNLFKDKKTKNNRLIINKT